MARPNGIPSNVVIEPRLMMMMKMMMKMLNMVRKTTNNGAVVGRPSVSCCCCDITVSLVLVVVICSMMPANVQGDDGEKMAYKNHTATVYGAAKRDLRFLETLKELFSSTSPILVDHSTLPMLYIGKVDLSRDHPRCSQWTESLWFGCQKPYENRIRNAIANRYEMFQRSPWEFGYINTSRHQPIFTYDRQEEYIKKVSCCGMWQARQCLIEKFQLLRRQSSWPPDCPDDLVQRYLSLPNEEIVRKDVDDYCTEYREGSAICSRSIRTAFPSNSLLFLTIFFLLIIQFFL